MGNSIIPIYTEITYIEEGIYGGVTTFSTILWVLGALLLVCALVLPLIFEILHFKQLKIPGFLVITSGIFFILSIIVQYSSDFNGPAGTAIPIGLPVLFIIGGWLYYEGSQTDDEIDEEEIKSED